MEWYGNGTTTNKQHKIGQRNAKERCLLSCRPYLDVKKGEILSESDVFENIKKGIKTRFQIKAIEHNEWLPCSI